MSQPPVPITCPSCDADLPATLAVADGGSPELGDTLYGELVTCDSCAAEFEVLFYLD
jgi:hypothetical protein